MNNTNQPATGTSDESPAESLDGYADVAAVQDVAEGRSLLVEVNYVRVALFNLKGTIYAIEDVCTHDGGPLVEGEIVNEYEVECPRHGARFDIRSGEVTRGPAFIPTVTYNVQIVNDRIFMEAPL